MCWTWKCRDTGRDSPHECSMGWIDGLSSCNLQACRRSDRVGGVASARFSRHTQGLYASCNGASLFSGTIRIFGCVAPGTLLNRSDPLSLPPLDIVKMNRQYVDPKKSHGQICVGAYTFDRSLVCIDKPSQKVTCYQGNNLDIERKQWQTLDDWITTEWERLSFLFSPEGRRLVPEHLGLPNSSEPKIT
jgi:hypothetical protein